MKLRNLILASGLAALTACGDTNSENQTAGREYLKMEYGLPINTEVEITLKYIPPLNTSKLVPNQIDGKTFLRLEIIRNPARYIVIITSKGCTQTVNSKSHYEYFEQNETDRLGYRDIYQNIYSQGLYSAEVLLKSEKVGCEFILPIENNMADKK